MVVIVLFSTTTFCRQRPCEPRISAEAHTHYRGSTWPQISDQVCVVKTGHVGVVKNITGQGLSERFIVSMLAEDACDQRSSYALNEIRRAEISPIDRAHLWPPPSP